MAGLRYSFGPKSRKKAAAEKAAAEQAAAQLAVEQAAAEKAAAEAKAKAKAEAEAAAKADYPNMKVQKMFMRANGKAIATDNADGFVKIISNEDKILGAWIVGSQATEIIHEIIAIAKQNGTVQNLADMMHAHPTICEIISETAAI